MMEVLDTNFELVLFLLLCWPHTGRTCSIAYRGHFHYIVPGVNSSVQIHSLLLKFYLVLLQKIVLSNHIQPSATEQESVSFVLLIAASVEIEQSVFTNFASKCLLN